MYSTDRYGNFTSANEGLAKMAGVSVQELLQMSFGSFCHPDHLELVMFHSQNALAGEATVFEAPFLSADKKEVILQVNLVPIKVQDAIEGIYGIVKDMTALWEAEKVVLKKNSFLKANAGFISGLFGKGLDDASLEESFEGVGKAVGADRMYYFGVHSGPNGEPQISVQLEWTSGGVPRKKECPKMKNMDLELIQQVVRFEPDRPYATLIRDIQHKLLREMFEEKQIKSMLILPIFIKDELYGFIGFDDCKTERTWTAEEKEFLQNLSRNLTTALEKRAAEEELKEKKNALVLSEKKFRALVQEGSDMMAILDSEGRYKFVSESRFSILGINPNEMKGQTVTDYIHPDEVEELTEKFLRLESGKQIKVIFRLKNKDGEWHWVESKVTNMFDDPAVQGIVTNSRDITENRKAMEKIKQQNEALMEIAWNQSHIFRAPVARIMGLLQLMESEEMVAPEAKVFMEHLKSSAAELDGIIREIVVKTGEVPL